MYTVCMTVTSETIRKVTKVYSYVHTYHVLDHESPFGPHLSHKVVDLEIIFLLQSLHHCINSNECASSTRTITVTKQHQTPNTRARIVHTRIYANTNTCTHVCAQGHIHLPTQSHTAHLQWMTIGAVLFRNSFLIC